MEAVTETTVSPEVQNFIDKVNIFLQTYNCSSVRLAKSTGISQATVSQFLNGKYPGDIETFQKKITNVMTRETEKTQLKRSRNAFIETSI